MMPSFVLRGHEGGVQSLAFHSDSTLAAGDDTGTLRIWNLGQRRAEIVEKISKEGNAVLSLATIDESKWFGQIRSGDAGVWEIQDGQLICSYRCPVDSLSFCKGKSLGSPGTAGGIFLVPSNDDNTILGIDPRSQAPVLSILPLEDGEKRGMLCSLDVMEEKAVAIGYESGHITIVDPRRLDGCLATSKSHSQPVLGLALAAKERIWSGAPESAVLCQRYNTSKAAFSDIQTFASPPGCGGWNTMTVRSDNKIIAACGWDGRVRIYACSNPRQLAILDLHTAQAHIAAFSATCTLLATGSEDTRIGIWSPYPPS